MKRRDIITLLAGAVVTLVLCPREGRAQQARKTHRIGFLGATSLGEYRHLVHGLLTGLRQLGYEEGKNIVIEYRWAESRYDRLPELAAELVKLNVDVIVAPATPSAVAAKQATSTIPVVVILGDPIAAGLVASLARPGGNVTGVAFFFGEICAKRVELIKEAIPTLGRIAVFINPANLSHPIALAAMQRMASALEVELVPMEVSARNEIAAAVASAVTRQAHALIAIEDPLITSNARQIAAHATENGLPMIGFKPQAEAGALMEYGVDLVDSFLRSASLVDKILKGTSPAELPIQRAVKFDFNINLKTAKALGIELPTSLLVRADHVIE